MEDRKPDYDLEAALKYNHSADIIDNIETIVAEVVGQNDELNWYWIVKFKEEFDRHTGTGYALIVGWCDYTGWDCQSGIDITYGSDLENLVLETPDNEEYSNRNIRMNLAAQIVGTQPFGCYISSPGDKDRE